MFRKMRNHKGFTLIEMLVVIAIIAILVSVLVPVISTSRNKAKGAVDAANIRTMAAEVATRRVSENDESKLLEGLNIVDSEIVPGSNVVFYVVNENEIRAFYCTNLLFTNQLRGTVYNSAVAETGDLDSPYDTLPGSPETYRVLGALTADGDAYDSDAVKNVQSEALGTLVGNTAEGILENLGFVLDENGNIDIWDSLGNTGEILGNLDNISASTKIALIDSLMNQFGYDYDTAEKMVTEGLVGDALKNEMHVDDIPMTDFDTQYNTAVDNAIDSLKGEMSKPEYSFLSYCGCSLSESCTVTPTGSGWSKRYTHTVNKTWSCSSVTFAEFETYCDNYGLTAVNDHTHNETFSPTVYANKRSENCSWAHN